MTGIYVTTKLSNQSCTKLREFVDTLPLAEGSRIAKDKYHITLSYSKEGFDYKHSDMVEGAVAQPFKWDIFEDEDERILVLRVLSDSLQKRFRELEQQGYKCKFPDYKPHITVSTDTNVNVDSLPLPMFFIDIDYEYSEPIDDNYQYDPSSMCESFLAFFHHRLQKGFK